VRGLKPALAKVSSSNKLVAPLAGAWIETDACQMDADEIMVAPLAGAWIETFFYISSPDQTDVAPLAGAWIETGHPRNALQILSQVAPLAGAWIETPRVLPLPHPPLSHPSRVRGLKRDSGRTVGEVFESHPSRVRGLKLL